MDGRCSVLGAYEKKESGVSRAQLVSLERCAWRRPKDWMRTSSGGRFIASWKAMSRLNNPRVGGLKIPLAVKENTIDLAWIRLLI